MAAHTTRGLEKVLGSEQAGQTAPAPVLEAARASVGTRTRR